MYSKMEGSSPLVCPTPNRAAGWRSSQDTAAAFMDSPGTGDVQASDEDLPDGWERSYNEVLKCAVYYDEFGEIRFTLPTKGAGPTPNGYAAECEDEANQANSNACDKSQNAQAQDTNERTHDLIIYGATGYSGCLIVEHLDAVLADRRRNRKRRKIRWAIAGRNERKLESIARRCRSLPDVIRVEHNEEDLDKMVSDCKVVLSVVGPYLKHGEPVVAACVNRGTHYLDVTGEHAFVHYMAKKYHVMAKKAGVMIVHMMGQVMAPNDISCYKLVKELGPLKQYRDYFLQCGASSGGSHATGIEVNERMTQDLHEVLCDPFSLGGRRKCGMREEDKDCCRAETDILFPSIWLQPAYVSESASRMVRRSCDLFEETPALGVEYGENLSVFIRDGNTTEAGAISVGQMLAPHLLEKASLKAKLLKNAVKHGEAPATGDGPSEAMRSFGSTEAYAVGQGENGDWAHLHLTCPDAYEVTAITSIAGALTLVEEIEVLKPRAGVLTPAYAFHGSTWIDRVQERGFANSDLNKISWTLHRGKPAEETVKSAVAKNVKKIAEAKEKVRRKEFRAFAPPELTMQ